MMKQLLMAFTLAALVTSLAPSAFGSGTVTVTSAVCPSSYPNLGHATVTWSVTSDEPDNVALWAYMQPGYGNDAWEFTLEAMARDGSNYVDWISYHHDYAWDLNVGTDSQGLNGTYLTEADLSCSYP